jgi:hypothetical protein
VGCFGHGIRAWSILLRLLLGAHAAFIRSRCHEFLVGCILDAIDFIGEIYSPTIQIVLFNRIYFDRLGCRPPGIAFSKNNMKNPVCLIGVGEIGGVFARGALKAGYPVYPIVRGMDAREIEKKIAQPEAVVVSVGEKDLQPCLKDMPSSWKDKLILVQNELLPMDWEKHKLNPTVISIWFEKKRPQDYKVIIPSPVYGHHAPFVNSILSSMGIPAHILNNKEELTFELVAKNLYILTINLAGLEVGGTVGELWHAHQSLAKNIANDVLDIQFKLIGQELNRDKLITRMVEAFNGDLQHKCLGRTACERLERAIAQADKNKLPVKTLRGIYAKQTVKERV